MEIKTKFSIGDSVYFFCDYRIERANVVGISVNVVGECNNISYSFAIFPIRRERECFATKQELIDCLTK